MCLLLVAAALVRDTGLLFTGSLVIWLWRRKEGTRAALFATTAAPALLWFRFVSSRTLPFTEERFLSWPIVAPIRFALNPVPYDFRQPMRFLASATDLLAVCGLLLAVFGALWVVYRAVKTPEVRLMALFAVSAQFLWVWPDWREASYGCPRVIAPLLFLLALEWLEGRCRWGFPP